MRHYNNDRAPRFSENRYIKGQSRKLADEKLKFMDGSRLGDLSIGIEDNATCRKVRRIMEKRVAQEFWKNSSRAKKVGNRPRFEMRHQLTNHFLNIFGAVPQGFRYAA